MRITRIICDRCGKEIKGYPVELIPAYIARINREFCPDNVGNPPYEKEQCEKEYCEDCVKKIIAFANKMAEDTDIKSKAKKTAKESRPAVESKRKIDVGKMVALRKAKWTIKDIAYEFSVSESAIYAAFKKLKEEGTEVEKDDNDANS